MKIWGKHGRSGRGQCKGPGAGVRSVFDMLCGVKWQPAGRTGGEGVIGDESSRGGDLI